MAILKKSNAVEDMGEKRPLFTAGGSINWYKFYGHRLAISKRTLSYDPVYQF